MIYVSRPFAFVAAMLLGAVLMLIVLTLREEYARRRANAARRAENEALARKKSSGTTLCAHGYFNRTLCPTCRGSAVSR